MKNIKLLLSAVLLIVVAVSCEKSDGGIDVLRQPQIKKYKVSKEMTKGAILDFEKTVIQSSSREKQTMELGEAVWKLEAAVNYYFRSDKLNVSPSSKYHTTFDVPIERTKDEYILSHIDIQKIYNKVLAYIQQSMRKKNENEYLRVADFSINKIDDLRAELSLYILLDVATGKQEPFQGYIRPCDYWYSLDKAGQCGPYEGSNVGSDATDILEAVLNYTDPLGQVYYTDIDFFEDIYNTYFCYYTQHQECLSPEDLKELLSLLNEEFLYDYYDIISCEVNCYDWWGHYHKEEKNKNISVPNEYFYHYEQVYRGVAHYR